MNTVLRDIATDNKRYVLKSNEMIANWRDDWLRQFFEDDKRSRKIPADIEDRLFRRLQMIDDATCDVDLSAFRRVIISRSCREAWPVFIRFE